MIHRLNRLGLWTLYMKEVRRFLKVQTQTIWAPAFTTLLFLVIFTVALGREGREVLGVPFATFVAPGLIVMAMMQNAFANSSFAFLAGKIQGTIVDYLMPPLSEGELMLALVGAAALVVRFGQGLGAASGMTDGYAWGMSIVPISSIGGVHLGPQLAQVHGIIPCSLGSSSIHSTKRSASRCTMYS